MATKVTSNGRLPVPKRVRDYLGIEPGAEVSSGAPPMAAS
jgi:AbrB family looped-hinge helix DNA binding protein